LSDLKHCLSINKSPALYPELKTELLAEQNKAIEKDRKNPKLAAEYVLNNRLQQLRKDRAKVAGVIVKHHKQLIKEAKAAGKKVWEPKPVKPEKPTAKRGEGTADKQPLESLPLKNAYQ